MNKILTLSLLSVFFLQGCVTTIARKSMLGETLIETSQEVEDNEVLAKMYAKHTEMVVQAIKESKSTFKCSGECEFTLATPIELDKIRPPTLPKRTNGWDALTTVTKDVMDFGKAAAVPMYGLYTMSNMMNTAFENIGTEYNDSYNGSYNPVSDSYSPDSSTNGSYNPIDNSISDSYSPTDQIIDSYNPPNNSVSDSHNGDTITPAPDL
jgi:hypothetical protein